jgi:hypothetical protein
MAITEILETLKTQAKEWGAIIEPPASADEIAQFKISVKEEFQIELPCEYLEFLQIANGLEFNGLIIYGTRNSTASHDTSPLDFFEMNVLFKESYRIALSEFVVIGEDSTGILTFSSSLNQFEYRDRIGVDRVTIFPNFKELLKSEVVKVM